MFKHEGQHHVWIIRENTRYEFVLDDDISTYRSGRNFDIIGSKFVRSEIDRNYITVEEEGI